MAAAADRQIAAYAQDHALTLITRDFDFADIRNYPPELYLGIVVLELPDQATASAIVATVIALLQNTPVLDQLPGRLAVVQPHRIRLRPA